jgi:DGQHR domain-containing protein
MTYLAVCAQQSSEHQVLSFATTAADVLRFAAIERIGRNGQGELSGFQRPQVAAHIREIRDYLDQPNSVLPNPIVVAFTDRVEIEDLGNGTVRLSINMNNGVPGLVVDGQQRLSALAEVNRDFQIFVSALICRDEAELRRLLTTCRRASADVRSPPTSPPGSISKTLRLRAILSSTRAPMVSSQTRLCSGSSWNR